ncbi:MAG: 23S rRNA (guanosine(2251)-2'-O)-methyltransferase RlmB [Dethiobacter sp.]|mgnify:CR=1 FL=1|jgi:23S rRNA (guanosine2251-2'-O)-methyltransferase|nr:23S rRNA (guanosine(2251)-2'-O)-methyltransferase RlmB [Dethiobacter sp.]MBS3897536.1 23S rRNA (guanosine(2251)-2'-O)-methyltransferase RlmB [Dethiobacter sp.]MBS3982197.1 23S rRNA (guanosine(2251)-2'-O)-methyltransferase RlmB [Dethiobacter sp.]MCL4463331.1 23S rRNA (guanosine(2251)-2'-O)-methyltransferase RlmB [Bacillota bacterium]MCL5993539.1 23S rRNA (guanosine(2251)-2'-O)-methyltransferase RlmB [Bacillota bacterium]
MDEKRTIEGRRPVLEALQAGSQITRILLQKGSSGKPVTEILELAERMAIPVEYRDKGVLERLAATRNHQGVLAETPPFRYTPFEELLAAQKGEPPFLVLLDHVQDPHNLGALIRTAYAAGCHGVVIPERRAAQMTPAAVRTAAGAAEYLPVAQVVNIARCLEQCKEAGLWVYGADMGGETLYSGGDYKGAVALVIGSEGEGLTRLVKEKCDYLVRLPMRGKVASLNASVAGALLFYEVYRQREGH